MKNSDTDRMDKLARRFYRAFTYKERRLMQKAGIEPKPTTKQPQNSGEK